ARVVRLAATGPMTVGRSPQATLCLEGDLVSRTHAVLEVANGGVLVEDRSSNGTMVGEEVVHRTSVWAAFGTPIVVGPFALSLHPAGGVEAAPPPPPPAPRAPYLQRGAPGKPIPPAPPIPTSRSAPPPPGARAPASMPPPPKVPHLPPTL